MSRDVAKMRLLLLLALIGSHQTTITGDVINRSDDVCISSCSCSATAIICKREDVLTSFPRLRTEAASRITYM